MLKSRGLNFLFGLAALASVNSDMLTIDGEEANRANDAGLTQMARTFERVNTQPRLQMDGGTPVVELPPL